MDVNTAINVTKKTIKVLAGLGASRIAHVVIDNNMSEADKRKKKDAVTVPVASLAIGAMFADAVGDYTDKAVDEAVNTVRELKAAFDSLGIKIDRSTKTIRFN